MDEITQLLDRSKRLIEDRLKIEAPTLEKQLRKAGRLLPRGRRRDGAALVQAERLGQHPKLARLTSGPSTIQAGERLIHWLEAVDPQERKTTARLHLLAGIAFNLLIVGAVLLVVLRWRGLI